MALSGIHVACSFAGGSGKTREVMSLLRAPVWSETQASAGMTSKAAPDSTGDLGEPVFHVIASADSWISIGPAPDATNGTRFYVKSMTEYELYVKSGDKLAWISA